MATETTQPALLLKGAYQHPGGATPSRTVMVVVNGSVVFMPLADVDAPLKFTLEQWDEIAAFVGDQIWRAQRNREP